MVVIPAGLEESLSGVIGNRVQQFRELQRVGWHLRHS